MLELLSDPQIWLAFLTLTALELVLGIDNIIFISILVDKLPPHQREAARKIGLFGAMFMRIGLLTILAWIVGLKATLFTVFGQPFSGRDIVFSLDSIITAVGMVDQVAVMVAAVVTSVGLMMVFAKPIGQFVSNHPTIKMLALSFLVAIGVVLIAESFGTHVPKGYIYSAMLFSVIVEMLNLRMRKRSSRPVDIIASIATPDEPNKK